MKYAISETARRRELQIAHNVANGITPKGVEKKIRDLIDGVYGKNAMSSTKKRERKRNQATGVDVTTLNATQFAKQIKVMEQQMHTYAKDLEFEQAAHVRDEIDEFKRGYLLSA